MADAPHWQAAGRSRVSAFIVVPDADAVVAFAKSVFDAEDLRPPLRRANGDLWNAELRIGDSSIMIGEGGPEMTRQGFVYVQVPDAQATFDRAVAAGATPIMPPEKRFYGDIDGGVADMAGNLWWIGTHVEDVPDDELERRARAEEEARK